MLGLGTPKYSEMKEILVEYGIKEILPIVHCISNYFGLAICMYVAITMKEKKG